jgi:hypothetical protein
MSNVSQKAEQQSPQTEVITLSEVLRIYESGEAFSITFITADRRKGTGGERRHYPVAQRCRLHEMPANLLKRNGFRSTATDKKSPNHWENKTRNIYIPATGEIRKLHIKLIVSFNNKRVLL